MPQAPAASSAAPAAATAVDLQQPGGWLLCRADGQSEPVPDSRGTSSGGAGPAAAPGGASGREDLAWKMSDHSGRLAFLAAAPPANAPPNVNLQPGAPDAFVQALRQHAINRIDGELLCDRREIWDGEPVPGKDRPQWMYLMGKTLTSHTRFHGWSAVLKEELQCDDSACQSFVKLFATNPPEAPHGYMEACRVLAHIFKDKSKDADEVIAEPRGWPRYLQRASEEAIEALEHWKDVKDLLHTTSSRSDWNAYTPAPPPPARPGDASWPSWSSSANKGMGKGKTMVLQEGPRWSTYTCSWSARLASDHGPAELHLPAGPDGPARCAYDCAAVACRAWK